MAVPGICGFHPDVSFPPQILKKLPVELKEEAAEDFK